MLPTTPEMTALLDTAQRRQAPIPPRPTTDPLQAGAPGLASWSAPAGWANAGFAGAVPPGWAQTGRTQPGRPAAPGQPMAGGQGDGTANGQPAPGSAGVLQMPPTPAPGGSVDWMAPEWQQLLDTAQARQLGMRRPL